MHVYQGEKFVVFGTWTLPVDSYALNLADLPPGRGSVGFPPVPRCPGLPESPGGEGGSNRVARKQTKRCTRCGETKPLDEFHGHARSRDGKRSECKACVSERNRRYHEANREQELERSRRYHEAHPEYQQRYYQAHRDEMLEYQRRYHEANREHRLAGMRRWKVQHGADGYARTFCEMCGRYFSNTDTWEWTHHRSPVTGKPRVEMECLDPASRGLTARPTEVGVVWGWPRSGELGAQREIRRRRRRAG